jgi:hypothetical protein
VRGRAWSATVWQGGARWGRAGQGKDNDELVRSRVRFPAVVSPLRWRVARWGGARQGSAWRGVAGHGAARTTTPGGLSRFDSCWWYRPFRGRWARCGLVGRGRVWRGRVGLGKDNGDLVIQLRFNSWAPYHPSGGAGHGPARRGLAGLGRAGRGVVRQGQRRSSDIVRVQSPLAVSPLRWRGVRRGVAQQGGAESGLVGLGKAWTAAGEGLRPGATPGCCITLRGARRGMALQGRAGHGSAWRGWARHGSAAVGTLGRFNSALLHHPSGGAWLGAVWHGEARRGLVRRGPAWTAAAEVLVRGATPRRCIATSVARGWALHGRAGHGQARPGMAGHGAETVA